MNSFSFLSNLLHLFLSFFKKFDHDFDGKIGNLYSTDDWESSEKSHCASIADSMSTNLAASSFVILSKVVAWKKNLTYLRLNSESNS